VTTATMLKSVSYNCPQFNQGPQISGNVSGCTALNGRTVSASGSRCAQTDIPDLF